MSEPPEKRENRVPYFEIATLLAISIEGIAALVLGLSIPSEAGSSVAFGFSPSRLALFSASLAGVFFPAALAIRFIRTPSSFGTFSASIRQWLSRSDRAYWASFGFLAIAGLSTVTLVFHFRFNSYWGITESVIIQRSWSFIAWLGLASLHIFSLLAKLMKKTLSQNRDFRHPRLTTSVTALLIVILSYSHWLILRYGLPIFTAIPDWFWYPLTRYGFNTGLYLPLVAATFVAIYLLIRREWSTRSVLPFLYGLALVTQLSIGFIRGNGIEALREHYLRLDQREYAYYVSSESASIDDIFQYEEKFKEEFWFRTKPPGYLLTYLLIRAGSDAFLQAGTSAERLESITKVIAVLLPAIASLAVLPIYAVGRILTSPRTGRIASAFYVTAPSFVLMTMRLDQSLFPVLFAIGLYLLVVAFRSQKGLMAFAAGAFAYGSIYITFSLIPLILLSVSYLVFAQIRATRRAFPLGQYRLLYMYILGVAIAAMALYLALDFDFFNRFSNAITFHRVVMGIDASDFSFLSAFLLNNIEYGTWIGSALTLLSLAGVLVVLRNRDRGKAMSIRPLILSGGFAWLALNAFGQTRGETGRLWLFLLPFVVLLASQAIHGRKIRIGFLVAMISAVQITTTLLLLQFQFPL